MDLMKAIRTRRSTRKYLPTPVEKATLEELLQAAVMAPSAMNSQPWAFGIVQGVETLRQLSTRAKAAILADADKLPWIERYRAMLENPDYNIFYDASALVVICAKPIGPNAPADCAMAAENLMLAAHDKGLATCWIGFALMLLMRPEVKQELGIPVEYTPVAPLIVGYPDGEMPAPERTAPEIICWK